jgi:hypothetical protein
MAWYNKAGREKAGSRGIRGGGGGGGSGKATGIRGETLPLALAVVSEVLFASFIGLLSLSCLSLEYWHRMVDTRHQGEYLSY